MPDTLGRYELNEKIGEGGFGRVYLGWDRRLQRKVAIKILPKTTGALEEAVIMARLDHPHIVRVYDVVQGQQSIYIVMEYVKGAPVNAKVLTPKEIVDVGLQVCSGLGFAHQAGIIHQDIKPENVLISGGVCKITDFGIAVSDGRAKNAVAGTPRYMAPEQRENGVADERTDIFSVGRLLAELAEECVDNIPLRLRAIIRKAIQPNPLGRYQSVWEMEEALKTVNSKLPTYQLMQSILPDIEEGYNFVEAFRPLPSFHLGKLLYPILTTAIMIAILRSGYIDPGYYAPYFHRFLAPLVVGLIAYWSPAFGVVSLCTFALPPLVHENASLGVFAIIWFTIFLPTMFRYPAIVLLVALSSLYFNPAMLLAATVVVSLRYSAKAGLLTSLLVLVTHFLQEHIPATFAFNEWLNSHGNAVNSSHLLEYFATTTRFFGSEWVGLLLFLFFTAISTKLISRFGIMGVWLFVGFSGLVVAFFPVLTFSQWSMGTMLFITWYLVVQSPASTRKRQMTKRFSLSPEGIR